jgi:hypothetical protein
MLAAGPDRPWLAKSCPLPRRAAYARACAARCGVLEAGALHAGGASGCGLGSNVSGPDDPVRRTRSPCWQSSPTGHDLPSPVSSASRRVHAGLCCPNLPAADPVQPDMESWSSPCWRSPRWRPPSCGLGAGVSGPDAQDQDPLFMVAARPGSTGHGPPSPVPSTSHCVLAVLVLPAAAAS